MKKKKYTKPEFKEVEIQLNNLCVGSVCTEVDISVEQGGKTDMVNALMQGQTKEMWDATF